MRRCAQVFAEVLKCKYGVGNEKNSRNDTASGLDAALLSGSSYHRAIRVVGFSAEIVPGLVRVNIDNAR